MSAAKNLPATGAEGAPQGIDSGRVQGGAQSKPGQNKSDPVHTRMHAIVSDSGPSDSLRHSILYFVSLEKYDRAKEEMRRYISDRKDYPHFQMRASKYKENCFQMMDYIQHQRSIPGINNLPFSRQQDHFERILKQFESMKGILAKIEQIEMEIRLEDVRSTVVLVRAVLICGVAIFIVVVVNEVGRQLLPSAAMVFDYYTDILVNKFFDITGW